MAESYGAGGNAEEWPVSAPDGEPELYVVQAAVRDWHRGKYPKATLADIGLKLCEESGEVAKALDRIHYAKDGEEEQRWRINLTEEIGDAALVLMVLCCKGCSKCHGTRVIAGRRGDERCRYCETTPGVQKTLSHLADPITEGRKV